MVGYMQVVSVPTCKKCVCVCVCVRVCVRERLLCLYNENVPYVNLLVFYFMNVITNTYE